MPCPARLKKSLERNEMSAVRAHKWKVVHVAVVAAGFALLAGYLLVMGDWRLSLAWAFAFPAIAISASLLLVGLKVYDRFPVLGSYLRCIKTERTISKEAWTLHQVRYFSNFMRFKALPMAAAEDGLVCVPILVVGISPVAAILGGAIFGLGHLTRYNYAECIGKAIYYTLAILIVLPHGLLTVVCGHLMNDLIAMSILRILKRKAESELRSNNMVDPTRAEAERAGHHER